MTYHRNPLPAVDPVPPENPLRAMMDPPRSYFPIPFLRSIRKPPARRESLIPLRCVRAPRDRTPGQWMIPASPRHPLIGIW